MKRLLRCALVAMVVVPLAASAQAQKSADAPPHFDYPRYEGRYYEIARLPNSRQRECASDVVTTFLRRTDGDISFINQCVRNDGQSVLDIGRIYVASSDPASGTLRFGADQIGWTPWYRGTYRLIELAPDYNHAVIGSEDRSNLWILSRARYVSDEVYQRLVAHAGERGYDVSRLVRSPQSGL